MKAWIDRRFGTWRGLLRLLLAYAELVTGRLRQFRLRNPEQVQRVVFVCLGNICRSAFGDRVARESGLRVASLGLSTTTGVGSPDEARAAARRNGIDMDAHRAVDWGDFKVQPGDLFLVMEVRQAHELRRRLGDRQDVQVCLLGMWCSPAVPHLHDPFTLSAGYFDTCFARVRQATGNLNRALTGAARVPLRSTVPASEAK
jgi:protein-tyrosine phosphatase